MKKRVLFCASAALCLLLALPLLASPFQTITDAPQAAHDEQQVVIPPVEKESADRYRGGDFLDEGCLAADCVIVRQGINLVNVSWWARQIGTYTVYRTLNPLAAPFPSPDWTIQVTYPVNAPGRYYHPDGIGANTYALYTVIHNCPIPPNNNCANVIDITDGVHNFSTIGATTDNVPVPNGCTQITNDIWYRYHATCDANLHLSTCGSFFDTYIVLYSGNACPQHSIALACNDDACGLQSVVNQDVYAGQDYLIRLGGYNGAFGTGTLTVDLGPINDVCSRALPLADDNEWHNFNTTCASTDGPVEPYPCSPTGDVWYAYTGMQLCGFVEVSTCGSAFDTEIAVYESNNCGSLGTPIVCNDDTSACANGYNSLVRFHPTPNQVYYIRVGGFNDSDRGAGRVRLDEYLVSYFNDNCAQRMDLIPGSYQFGNQCSGTEPLGSTCGVVYNDLWFNLDVDPSTSYTISTCGSNFDTRFALYFQFLSGCENLGDAIACGDSQCRDDGTITFSTPQILIGTYVLRLGGAGVFDEGQFNLQFTVN